MVKRRNDLPRIDSGNFLPTYYTPVLDHKSSISYAFRDECNECTHGAPDGYNLTVTSGPYNAKEIL